MVYLRHSMCNLNNQIVRYMMTFIFEGKNTRKQLEID